MFILTCNKVSLLLQFKMTTHYNFKGNKTVLNVIYYNFALNELLE